MAGPGRTYLLGKQLTDHKVLYWLAAARSCSAAPGYNLEELDEQPCIPDRPPVHQPSP